MSDEQPMPPDPVIFVPAAAPRVEVYPGKEKVDDDSAGSGKRRLRAAEGVVAPQESGGRGGLDPTRFGDWEIKGRCIDF